MEFGRNWILKKRHDWSGLTHLALTLSLLKARSKVSSREAQPGFCVFRVSGTGEGMVASDTSLPGWRAACQYSKKCLESGALEECPDTWGG